MAYKQSPFPMIAGTSPVKQMTKLKWLKKGYNLAKKGVQAIKTVFKGDPQKKADAIRRQEVRKRYGGPDWNK